MDIIRILLINHASPWSNQRYDINKMVRHSRKLKSLIKQTR